MAVANAFSHNYRFNRWFQYMRKGEVNTVAPLASPEESPATSYAVVFLCSPVCLSIAWGPVVSR